MDEILSLSSIALWKYSPCESFTLVLII